MLQAAINIDSLMRRRRCTADCRSCCSQVQHVIDDRSIVKPAIADDPDLCLPHLHSTPPLRGSHRTIAMAFDAEKLEWFGYPMLKNIALFCTVFSYLTLNNIVTLKSGLEVTQDH